jgi:YHS domain-containing protein
MMKVLAIAASVSMVFFSTAALAQEKQKPLPEIMVNDGFAFSWKEDKKAKVVAYDVVTAWLNAKKRGPKVADCDKYKTTFKGATWCFASEANLKKFSAKTDKDGNNSYVPFAGGRCALGTSWGRLGAMGDPRTARLIGGDLEPMLVLQSNKKWWQTFEKEMFTRLEVAQMRIDFATRLGDIVPNDKLK